MEDIIFTVIITTYNRRDLLPRAIQSVLNQSFSKFELLVIDNGSTDDTRFVVQKIKDSRLQYILNPNPTASCDAPRNFGIKIARGSLISFLDDDDIWYPEKLEKVKKVFDENPDIPVVCHNENKRINGKISTIFQCGPWSDDIYERLLYEGCCLTPSAITIKTDLLRELNGFDLREEFNGAADYDLWLRMTAKGIKINFIEETLGEFSFTGNNCSIDPVFQSRVAYIIKEHILKYEKRPIFQISRRGMWRLFQLHYIAGRSFFKRRRYINAFKYHCKALIFVIIKPSAILGIFSRIIKQIITLSRKSN